MKEPCLPSREKYWSEIDSEQRVERLRTVIKRLEVRLKAAQKTIAKLDEYMKAHEHSPHTGLPLVEVKREYECENDGREPVRNDECYL